MGEPLPGGIEKIEGVLEQVIYRNEENSYTVARLALDGSSKTVKVTGNLLAATPGESLRCRGIWVTHAKFGKEFRVESYEIVPPSTEEGVVKYLSSGLIKGIGPKLAQRMVHRFGIETLRIIEEHPDRLTEIPGIGKQRLREITAAWVEQKEIQEIIVFLRSYGVGQAMATKIYARYGRDTVRLIQENPYRLCSDVSGIGFRTADRIAMNLGVEQDSPFRIRAVIVHVLEQAADEGHLCLPFGELVDGAVRATTCVAASVEEQIELLVQDGHLVIESENRPPFLVDEGDDLRMVFLRSLWEAEKGVHVRLKTLKHAPKVRVDLHPQRALGWAEKRSGLRLAPSQRDAVLAALQEPVLVITGGPGVGKTTIVRLIVEILKRKGVRIALAAPTGRAAKRLGEATGLEASTIHRLLKFNPKTFRFTYDHNTPLPFDLIIVDECSMIDVALAEKLLQAVPDSARICFVGDADQLPSVGPGDFLSHLAGSGRIPVVKLTTLFRQKTAGGIITAAHAVNTGEPPLFSAPGEEGEIFFIEQADAQKAADLVVWLVKERIPARFGFDPVHDVQVLTPMHKGAAGTEKLNAALKAALNPGGGGLARHNTTFQVGDKIMQTRNDYELEVFNGDIGFVESVDEEEGRLAARMDDGLKDYSFDKIDALVHAYCVSVHKSQGCEFPVVVLPLLTQHFLLLKRNLLYTGISRAKKLLVIVGSQKALRIAVGNDSISERNSLLENRLKYDTQL